MSDIVHIQASTCAADCTNLIASPDTNMTYWCSGDNGAEPWVLVDLGLLYHVTGILVHLPHDGKIYDAISVLATSDGVSWFTCDFTIVDVVVKFLHVMQYLYFCIRNCFLITFFTNGRL